MNTGYVELNITGCSAAWLDGAGGQNRRNRTEGESGETSREPGEKALFLLFMTTVSVMRMQQALGQRAAHVAQVTLVALTHHHSVLRYVQMEHLAR